MELIEAVYRQYFGHVYRYIMAISKDPDIAEDITAETFLKAMKALEHFEGKCDTRVWLCQIAKNTYLNYLRKQKVVCDEFEDIKDDTASVEKIVCVKEEQELIKEIVSELNPVAREVFNLRVFNDLSFKAIGASYNKSENWACVTFYRARIKVKEEMRLRYEDNM